MLESLHNHSRASDGVLSRLELLAVAEQLRIDVMAITDHDALPDARDLHELHAYTGPTKWFVGVELSSWTARAAGGNSDRGALHVLGLFVDPTNRPLAEFCAEAEANRRKRMQMYVKHLQGLGFVVTETAVQAAATSRNIGKPHMVKAVMAQSENRELVERMRAQMERAAETNPNIKTDYDRMMAEGPGQYPYTLFMGSEAFFPAPKADFGGLLPLEDTTKLIRGAGGVAVLAHWYMDQAKLTAAELEAVLADGQLDGLETLVVNKISSRDVSSEIEYLRELIKQHNLIEVMGADAHTVADLEAYAGAHGARASIGQTARIIEQVRPDLHWSNWR